MKFDILVYGPVFSDLIFSELDEKPMLGEEIFARDFVFTLGGSAIVAIGLHRLGAKVGLVADLGNDLVSRIAWELLGDFGLDRSLIRRLPHPLTQITVALSYPQDRAFITHNQRPDESIDIAEIIEAQKAHHIHLCSSLTALENPNIPQIAHSFGATVSMDPGWDMDSFNDPNLMNLISELDYFLPSQNELMQITRTEDLEQAAEKVLAIMGSGKLVIKTGSKGARLYSNEIEGDLQVPAIPVTAIDTTGAGDSFDAGFLYAVKQNLPLKTCMQYGAICGGLATTALGGATAFPTHSEVKEWLTKSPS